MKFDVEFEDEVLAAALTNPDYLRRAVRIARKHHFTGDERSWVWQKLSDGWQKYRELVTLKVLIAEARRDFPEADRRRPLVEFLTKLSGLAPDAPLAALDQLREFVEFVEAQIALEAAAGALEKGKVEEVRAQMARGARSPTSAAKYTHVRWVEEFDERQRQRQYAAEHPEEFKTIPTGFGRLDKAMSGGARAGELGLVVGTTGRGKSIMLSNFGFCAMKHGFRVVYFALEMPAVQVAMRADSRWSALEYSKFKRFDFLPAELGRITARAEKAAKKYANRFHILSFPVRSASMYDIRGALEDLAEEYEFTPDLLLMDSGDHLISPEYARESYRIQQADVYWKMKELAEEAGCVVWSSTHAGREWATRIASAESTAESYDKARIADTLLSLNEVQEFASGVDDDDDDDDAEGDDELTTFKDEDRGIRNMIAYLGKYRDGDSKFRFRLRADFSRMLMEQAE